MTSKTNHLIVSVISEPKEDCVFICGNDLIPAHRIVLACASPVFEKMLFGKMASKHIQLPDINRADFQKTIDFIYSGNIDFESVQNAWSMVYISQKYFLNDLFEKSVVYITDNLSIDNLFLCYEFSQLYNIEKLSDICSESIETYFKGLLFVDYHVKLDTLNSILNNRKSVISESDLVILLVKWALDECEIRKLDRSTNLIVILEENNLIKKFKSLQFNPFLYSFPDALMQIDSYFNLKQIISTILSLHLNEIPEDLFSTKEKFRLNYLFRAQYKISRGYFFSNTIRIVNDVTVSKSIYLFGLVISTLHQPAGVDSDYYKSNVCIRILNDKKSTYYCHHFVKNNIFYNHIQKLDFPIAVKLEPQKTYVVIVSYFNENANVKGKVVMSYCGDKITNKQNNSVITFSNELEGTVVQGASFFTA